MRPFAYRSAYRAVSWLGELFGGRRLLVRWKVALVALLLGASATVTSCEPTITGCYDIAMPPEEESVPEQTGGQGAIESSPELLPR
jgi:hypothetical protein